MSASRWEKVFWPRWLPETMRMPLVAQITGAVALTALVMGPWWSRVPSELPASTPTTIQAAPLPAPVPQSPAVPPPVKSGAPSRPAHLNLDVRHSFANVDFIVTVDGKRVLESKLEGSGKRFGMFGKRSERGFTRSLELDPGVHLVRVRLQSAPDKFDQTRTERFELGSASVASMRVTADKSGIDVISQHPTIKAEPPPAPAPAAPQQPAPAVTTASTVPLPAPEVQRADALAELLQSLRSMLIAIAGFVASAATGFVVQEYLRGRRSLIFAGAGGEVDRTRSSRRRRRRTSEAHQPEPETDAP